jgi:hypothetical protein
MGWINVFIGALMIVMAAAIIGVFYNLLGMRNRSGGYLVVGMILGGIGEVAWGGLGFDEGAKGEEKSAGEARRSPVE